MSSEGTSIQCVEHSPGEVFSSWKSVFAIPVCDQILVYAPLHNMAALVNRTAVSQLGESLVSRYTIRNERLGELADLLRAAAPPPLPRQGDLEPAFLGLLPTRSCNLACRYCGFLAPDALQKRMDLELARDAVNWYLDWAQKTGQREIEVHFFGGEPFCAPEILDLAVNLARIRAAEIGATVEFEVATNGVFDEARCQWAADNLDTIVLSFDGPADIQNDHRPYKDGRGSYAIVTRTAEILSEGTAQLFFRACITAETVERMPEIAAWFCRAYRPAGVCFEPVQPMTGAGASQFTPPDPWQFACQYIQAARILEAHGVETMYATADIGTRRVSFCPVGRDVVIVSPDGRISACYLLQSDWQARGLDLGLGCIRDGSVELDAERVAAVRDLNVWNKPFCSRCFCKWHCAGGCHVNHVLAETLGSYDRLCLQTRAISLRNILASMGRADLVDKLLADRTALEEAVLQPDDLLLEVEERR